MTEERVERFTSWGSRVLGIIGLAVVVGVVALGISGRGGSYHPAVYPVCGLFALLFWTVLIRPSVAAEGDLLVLRNPLSTVRVPLASIESVVIRQFLVVVAGDRRFTNAGIGRSHRQGLRDDRRGDLTAEDLAGLSYAGIAENRISALAEDTRNLQGVKLYSDEQQALAEQVRREWAWPEIGLLVAAGVASVVALLL